MIAIALHTYIVVVYVLLVITIVLQNVDSFAKLDAQAAATVAKIVIRKEDIDLIVCLHYITYRIFNINSPW